MRGLYLVAACSVGLAACGQVSTVGDPADADTSQGTRTITGTLEGGAGTSKAATSTGCEADTVIATATDGSTSSAAVDTTCNFSVSVDVGKSYVISFVLDGTFVATLIVDSGVAGFPVTEIQVGDGDATLELGSVTIEGTVATAANDPAEDSDTDGDEINDADDADDDGDDVPDEEECEENDVEVQARVLRVQPRKGAEYVGPFRTVRALFSCRIDPETITPETFRVAADGDEIDCHYRYGRWHRPWWHHLSKSHRALQKHLKRRRMHVVRCQHVEDPFQLNTTYTATIDGVRCLDGRAVAPSEWSWHTIDIEPLIDREEEQCEAQGPEDEDESAADSDGEAFEPTPEDEDDSDE